MKIYLKLYLWFLLIFGVTLVAVLLLTAHFYGRGLHDEVEEQVLSHAKFIQAEFEESCGWDLPMEPCRRFLKRVHRIPLLRFWVVDPTGNVLLSEETGVPVVSREGLQKASGGEPVLSVRRRSPVRVILPVESPGKIKRLLVLERAVFPRRHLPRFPLLFSLLIAGVVVAILVLPLSRRLTRPLRELHELGVSWSEGRLEQRSTLRGKDEISDLAATFNSMAGKLQRMLEQRKEFLALISHELKSPLARMRVALELLSEKDHADKQRQNLIQSMQEEITESEQLIEQLLVLSKVEMAPSHFSRVDVFAIAKKVVEHITPLADTAGVTIQIEGSPAEFQGDELQLQRAFSNIVANAVKFSPAGSTISLTVRKNAGTVLFECKDSGSGISSPDLQKIFEPFYRGQSAEKKSGAGLGLFIARRITEMHHGRISAGPNQPAGAIITIELPGNGES